MVNEAMEREAKARRFKSNSKYQLKTRADSSNVAASSEDHGSKATEHFLMGKAKRVKYAYSESARHPLPDVPKTSEYAFFKKLKEDLGSSCHTLRKDRDQFKTANANDPKTEKERPTCQFSFPSPPMGAASDYAGGLNSKGDFRKFGSRAPQPCTYVTPDAKNLVLSPFPSGLNISENRSCSYLTGDEYVGKGTFNVRRHKLRQFVANSYPEVGEGCSKGFDLVSVLLSRLFPGRYENECCQCQYARSEESDMDITYSLAGPRESYSEDSSKLNVGSRYNDDLREYWSGSPRKRLISKWDVTNSNTPLTKYSAANDFQIGDVNSFCSLDGEATEKNFLETDSFCYLCFENHQYTCSGHLKQKGRFEDPDEFAHTLLLSWDSNDQKEPRIGFFQQTWDDSLTALTRQAPSSISKYSLNLHSLPYFLSAGCRSHNAGIDKGDNYTAVAANHVLSFTPRCLTVTEDCDNCPEKNEVTLYGQDDPYCIGNGIGSGRKDHTEALPCPGGFTDGLGWQLLPFGEVFREDYSSSSQILRLPSYTKEDVNPFAFVEDEESSLYCPENRETALAFPEDAFNMGYWFSSNFHVSLDKFSGQPLLLNFSDRSEDATCSDDAENQWNSN